MKLQYFKETDTLYIECKESNISESRDLDENTIVDQDGNGDLCALTIEHASERTDVNHLVTERIAA